jgi:hypothetical protein
MILQKARVDATAQEGRGCASRARIVLRLPPMRDSLHNSRAPLLDSCARSMNLQDWRILDAAIAPLACMYVKGLAITDSEGSKRPVAVSAVDGALAVQRLTALLRRCQFCTLADERFDFASLKAFLTEACPYILSI